MALISALTTQIAFAESSPADDPLLTPISSAPKEIASWEQAVEIFSQHSTDLQVSAAEVGRALGQRRVAVSALLPSINGTAMASFSLLASPDEGDGATSALFGSAPFQTIGLLAQLSVIDASTWAAVAAANDGVSAARLSLANARRLLLVNLAQALLNAVAAERVAELNRVGLRDALDRLRLAERANSAGASTELDVGRLRQDAHQARLQVVSGDEAVRQAREVLALALGEDTPSGVSHDFNLNGLSDAVKGTCRAVTDLKQRADVQAEAERVEQADRNVLRVKAQFLPSFGLRSTAQNYFFGDQSFPVWNLQAVLTVPIWDGGARYGQMRDAKALRSQAEARKVSVTRAGRVDIDRARRGIDVAEQSRELARLSYEQAQKTDVLTRKAYDAGLGTSLELVTAASMLRQQQLALALRDYDVLRARVVALFALADCSP